MPRKNFGRGEISWLRLSSLRPTTRNGIKIWDGSSGRSVVWRAKQADHSLLVMEQPPRWRKNTPESDDDHTELRQHGVFAERHAARLGGGGGVGFESPTRRSRLDHLALGKP